MFQDIAIDVAFRGYGLDWQAPPEALVEAARRNPRPLDRVEREAFDAALDFALRHRAHAWADVLAPEDDEPRDEDPEVVDEDLIDDAEVDPPEAWELAATEIELKAWLQTVRGAGHAALTPGVGLAYAGALGVVLLVSILFAVTR